MNFQDADPVSEDVAREWTSSFVVREGSGKRRLHLEFPQAEIDGHDRVTNGGEPQQDRPLCEYDKESSPIYRRKAIDVYPPGFHEICRWCRKKLSHRLTHSNNQD